MGCISGLTPDVPIGWPHRMCLSDHWMCPRLWTHGEVRPPSPRLGLRRLAVLLLGAAAGVPAGMGIHDRMLGQNTVLRVPLR